MSSKLYTLFVLSFAILVFAACTSQPLLVGTTVPTIQADNTAIEELAARVAALEAQLVAEQTNTESHATESHGIDGQRFDVVVATYLLDNAGLHDLDERLNGEGVIESSDAGRIRRIRGVVAAAPWPEEVHSLATELLAAMDGLQEALAADDAEAAAPLATQVHDVGHDLSHEVGHWIAESSVDVAAHEANPFDVVIATYLLDNAGLHDLDERLNGEGTIESSDAGKIGRIRGVVAATHWPEEVQPVVEELLTAMESLQEALAADDAEAAAPLATQVHDVGHDLSHEIEAWLGGGEGGSH